jgi:phosphate transport system permease protein
MAASPVNDISTLLVGEDADSGAGLVVGLGALSLLVAIVLFLASPALVVFPLFAFVLIVAVGWVTYQPAVARLITLIATVSTVLTVGFITYFLFANALPGVTENGLELLMIPQDMWFFELDRVLPVGESYWNPSANVFSLIPTIWGTVIVTAIAGSIAGPLGIFGALFISEVASPRVRAVVKPGVEILAGIPSIVFGFIGFMLLNSFVQTNFLDQGPSYLIAGIVVGFMALPTVVSVAEDALTAVPDSMNDGAVAMGATKWQTMKSISIPAAFSGISAAVILGLGRAIGETMAVAAIMAAGVNKTIPLFDVFDSSATLTSLIATQYGTASESMIDVLFVAGVILFTIVASMSIVSMYIQQQMTEKMRGEA